MSAYGREWERVSSKIRDLRTRIANRMLCSPPPSAAALSSYAAELIEMAKQWDALDAQMRDIQASDTDR